MIFKRRYFNFSKKIIERFLAATANLPSAADESTKDPKWLTDQIAVRLAEKSKLEAEKESRK